MTLENVLKLSNGDEIKAVIVKVITISRDIQGSYGTYNIGTIKDISGTKLDINLYNKKLTSKLNIGEIWKIKNLKFTEFNKNDEKITRLVTTSRSSCDRPSDQTVKLLKDVPLGDRKEKVKVVAVDDIYLYSSCSQCKKKTQEDDLICKCGNTDDIHVNDFNCKFYIEIQKDKDIEVVLAFKRQTNIILHDLNDCGDMKSLLDENYLMKTFIFEWNEDKNKEEGILVKITSCE